MARLLFAKLEVRVVCLLGLIAVLGAIGFGFLVLDGAKDTERFVALSQVAVNVAKIPNTVRDLISPPDRVRIWKSERFDAKPTGWSKPPTTNGRCVADPVHLNDFQPVLSDGPYWKKGDLLLSLRNMSTIMLYRPPTDRIIWWKVGPWMAQHDVDVLDQTRISVYDNHAEDRGGGAVVRDQSDVVVYDFATDMVRRPHEAPMKAEKIRRLFAGLYTALPDGYALIEDVTDPRLMIAGPDGKLAAEYTNRADSGHIYQLG